MTDEQYINFDEYIRQGEPDKRARADASTGQVRDKYRTSTQQVGAR